MRLILAIIAILFTLTLSNKSIAGEDFEIQLYPQPIPAPNISYMDSNGDMHSLESLNGQVVLVNIWSTWCAPCVVEMPTIDALSRRYSAAGLKVLALAIDTDMNRLKKFFKKHELNNLDILRDVDGKAGKEMLVRTLPSSFVINKQGELLGVVNGAANWFSDEARALIEKELKQKISTPRVISLELEGQIN